MNRRTNALLLSGTLLLSVLVSCGSGTPIKLGFVMTLSGRTSGMGLEEKNAVVLAVEEINGSGGIDGRPVEVVYADDRNDPDEAREIMEGFIRDGKEAVIGHSTSNMTLSTYDLAVDAGMVVVSASSSTPILSDRDDFFYRLTAPADQGAENLADYLYGVRGHRKPAIIFDLSNSGFTEELTRAFTERFRELGGDPLEPFSFNGNDSDAYPEIIEGVLAQDPDSVVFVAVAVDTALLSQQVRKHDTRIRLYSSSWAKTNELIFYGGSAVESMIFVHAHALTDDNMVTDDFSMKYRRRFGSDPSFVGHQAYEAVYFLAEGFRRLETGDSPDLRSALNSIRQMDGTMETLYFNEYGDVQKEHFVTTIRDGRFINVEE